MREIFPDKKPGDSLEASHVNALNKVARRLSGMPGSNLAGFSGPFSAVANLEPVVQWPLRVVQDEDGLSAPEYQVAVRYYTGSAWATDSDNLFVLDASESGQTFSVGDNLMGLWNGQRQAFMPVAGGSRGCSPLVDIQSGGQPIPRRFNTLDREIVLFALEQSQNGLDNWRTVNGRVYSVNISQEGINPRDIEISGTGIYTFYANEDLYLRLTMIAETRDLELEFAAIRLEAHCNEGQAHSVDEALEDAAVVTDLSIVASSENDGDGLPSFSNAANDTILITVPDDQNWTIKGTVSIKIGRQTSQCHVCVINYGGNQYTEEDQCRVTDGTTVLNRGETGYPGSVKDKNGITRIDNSNPAWPSGVVYMAFTYKAGDVTQSHRIVFDYIDDDNYYEVVWNQTQAEQAEVFGRQVDAGVAQGKDFSAYMYWGETSGGQALGGLTSVRMCVDFNAEDYKVKVNIDGGYCLTGNGNSWVDRGPITPAADVIGNADGVGYRTDGSLITTYYGKTSAQCPKCDQFVPDGPPIACAPEIDHVDIGGDLTEKGVIC